jgi:DDE superfamily endonuclease
LAELLADDIRIACGISRPSFYLCVYQGISLIIFCNKLDIRYPRSTEDIDATAAMFKAVSRNNVMQGCVGAQDGWLCWIVTPSANETTNARSFHRVHYNAKGVKVQSCCDSKCQFIHVSINAPGSTKDDVAYAESSLSELVENLPDGKYIVGDNA